MSLVSTLRSYLVHATRLLLVVGLGLTIWPSGVIRCAEPVVRSGAIGAIMAGQRVTAGAIGGRFALVDTLWVDVTSDAAVDRRTGAYTYTYEVANSARSRGDLDWFVLSGVTGAIDHPTSPPHWKVVELPEPVDPRIVWAPDLGSPPPGWVDDGVDVYVSEFAIRPGHSVKGFGFTSTEHPREGSYGVTAYEPLPSEGDEIEGLDRPSFGARGYALVPVAPAADSTRGGARRRP